MNAESLGQAQSTLARLARHARSLGVDANLVLTRFATERFLYRISRSPHAGRFVLKGALLMLVWFGETIRPTRDADLLGFGRLSDEDIMDIFRDVCATKVDPDAMTYLQETIRVTDIRPEDAYGGRRVTLRAQLGSARLRVQADIGIGDAVVPAPRWLEYPSLLDLPRPRLKAYRPETVIAEKFHAMVALGAINSRMRDFFDVYLLANSSSVDRDLLDRAIRATFKRRRTTVPDGLPFALTTEFATMKEKQTQWRAFLKKNGLASVPDDLGKIVECLARFLAPILDAARANGPSPKVEESK